MSTEVKVENTQQPTAQPTEEQVTKAKRLYLVSFILLLTAFIIQIVAQTNNTDVKRNLLYGTKMYSNGDLGATRVERGFQPWMTCQRIYGFVPKGSSLKTECVDSKNDDCNSISQRIKCIQASGIIAVILTGFALIPSLLAGVGVQTTNGSLKNITLVFTFIAMSFTMIFWTIVAHLKYSVSYFCDGMKIIDVDGSISFGDAFALETAAWCLLLLAIILIFVAGAAVAPATQEVKEQPAAEEGKAAGPSEPVATTTAPAAAAAN